MTPETVSARINEMQPRLGAEEAGASVLQFEAGFGAAPGIGSAVAPAVTGGVGR